ncbi:MAG: phosphoribosylglycinamide formyltransferase [Bacteroidota bacterium]
MPQHKIAIFVSGTGSNARVMIDHFRDHPEIEVALLVSNKRKAKALLMAADREVPTLVLNRQDFYEQPDFLLNELRAFGVNFIVLAGFLWLIPAYLVEAFPQQIVNIHPALLPKYGGKGMYGHHVHEAVKTNAETESGMTIHYVNEQYDEGNIIFQARTSLLPEDSAEDIAAKVLQLEHAHYSKVVEDLLLN